MGFIAIARMIAQVEGITGLLVGFLLIARVACYNGNMMKLEYEMSE